MKRDTCLEANSHQVLPCYLQEGSFQPYWTLQNEEVESSVTLDTYERVSQFWPSATMSGSGQEWKHRLHGYRPEEIRSTEALLMINNGTRNPVAATLNQKTWRRQRSLDPARA